MNEVMRWSGPMLLLAALVAMSIESVDTTKRIACEERFKACAEQMIKSTVEFETCASIRRACL